MEQQPIKILIVHRNQLFREMLANSLSNCQSTAFEPGDTQRLITSYEPDVAIIDAHLPARGSFGLVSFIHSRLQNCRTVLMADAKRIDEALATLIDCLKNGCRFMLAETCDMQTVKRSCDPSVDRFRSDVISDAFDVLLLDPRLAVHACDPEVLTERQLEVVRLIADGLRNEQIGERLGCTTNTVKNHVHSILKRLDVKSRAAAVNAAASNGWL